MNTLHLPTAVIKAKVGTGLFALAATLALPTSYGAASAGGVVGLAAANQRPRVYTAGTVVTNVAQVPVTVRLAGAARDDGRPKPPRLTNLWTQVSGPSQGRIANRFATNTTVTLARAGDYRFNLTVGDGQARTTVPLNIKVLLNRPPEVNAGPDLTVTLPNPPFDRLTYPKPSVKVALEGSVRDDGNPVPPGRWTCRWRRVSGPGSASIADPTKPRTDVTFTAPGRYTMALEASDGALKSKDTVNINVRPSALSCLATRFQSSPTCGFPGRELWVYNSSSERTIRFTIRVTYGNPWGPDTTKDLTFVVGAGKGVGVVCTDTSVYPKYRNANFVAAEDVGGASLAGLSAEAMAPEQAADRLNDEAPPTITIRRVEAGTSDATAYEIAVEGVAGRRYQVESSADLADWMPHSEVEGPAARVRVEMPSDGAVSARFFRVLLAE